MNFKKVQNVVIFKYFFDRNFSSENFRKFLCFILDGHSYGSTSILIFNEVWNYLSLKKCRGVRIFIPVPRRKRNLFLRNILCDHSVDRIQTDLTFNVYGVLTVEFDIPRIEKRFDFVFTEMKGISYDGKGRKIMMLDRQTDRLYE